MRLFIRIKKLYDVSAVTFPAYEQTSVGTREQSDAIEKEIEAPLKRECGDKNDKRNDDHDDHNDPDDKGETDEEREAREKAEREQREKAEQEARELEEQEQRFREQQAMRLRAHRLRTAEEIEQLIY